MRRFFWILLTFSAVHAVSAQPGDSARFWKDSFPKVSYRMIIGPRYCFFEDKVIESDSEYTALKLRCPEVSTSLDFTKEMLVSRYVGGDCHAWYRHEMYLDTIRKKMVWIVYNYYGGCRAGGGRSFWCVLPRLPQGYTLEMTTLLKDRDEYEMRKE